MIFFVLFLVAYFGWLLGVVVYVAVKDKNEQQALQALARRLGWTFQPVVGQEMLTTIWLLELFHPYRPDELRNYLFGKRGGRRVGVFEYRFEGGTGDYRQMATQTVVKVPLPGAGIPEFALKPGGRADRLVGLFKHQDYIKFDSDPDFSRACLLRGADEAAIRDIFDADVRDFYHRHPDVYTEVAGENLYFWRLNKRATPEEIEALVDEALDIAVRVARHAALLPAAGA